MNLESPTAGDKLRSTTSETVYVESVTVLELEESVKVYNFEVENTHNYFVGHEGILVHNACKGSIIPVKDRVTARNGLDYKSNPKHTPGQPGNRFNAGIEPQNLLELFEKSVESSKAPGVRFTYDESTGTLHRFFNSGDGSYHWSGSTNQGVYSLSSDDVPIDIRRMYNMPSKGW